MCFYFFPPALIGIFSSIILISFFFFQLEKLLGEIIAYLHFNYTGTYDSELLEHISPLLCIIFLHKNKQIRKQSAQFWNATFAKVTTLIYPEELKYANLT